MSQLTIILYSFTFLSLGLNAQNLISNSGFSDKKDLIDFYQKGWHIAKGTPDLFFESDEGVVGVILYMQNHNELITCKLKDKLKKNISYTVGLDIRYRNKGSMFSTSDFCILFSNKPFNEKKKITYQICNDSLNILNDPSWRRFEWNFIASGKEKYITIGNFKSPSITNVKTSDGKETIGIDKASIEIKYEKAYYFLDNIYLYESNNPPVNTITNEIIRIDKDSLLIVEKKKDIITQSPFEFGLNEVYILDDVHFDFNKSELKDTAKYFLKNVIEFLYSDTTLKVSITGHTDNIGGKEYNYKLSEKRAISVAQFLIEQGVEKDRLNFKGFGSSTPIGNNKTEDGRKKNRRVELEFYIED